MNDREKLVELLDRFVDDDWYSSEEIAENLIAHGVTVQRWIPVTERLPEDFEEVLVYFEYFRYGEYNRLYRTIGTSYTFQGSWSGFVNGTSGWRDLKILAWMPQPEPPKEDVE